jgi:hypothetical protein
LSTNPVLLALIEAVLVQIRILTSTYRMQPS